MSKTNKLLEWRFKKGGKMKMTREEMDFRAEGYFQVLALSEEPKESILEKINRKKVFQNERAEELAEIYKRGAYDALIGLDIIKPLGKSEAAKKTGYTRNAIQKAIENGYLRATLVDGHYNIHPLDLEAWRNSDKKRKPYRKIEKP